MDALLFLPAKIFALIVGIYYLKYLPRAYKLILILTLIAAFSEGFGYLYSHFSGKSNAWIFNFYMLIEAWGLGIAAVYLINNQYFKNVFFLLLILNTIIWVAVIIINSLFLFATISLVCSCCIITVMYILVLYNNSLFSNERIIKQPVFWLCIATILYFGCDIPYMGLQSYLIAHNPALVLQLDNINMILDHIRYPLVAISFILLGRQKQVALKSA